MRGEHVVGGGMSSTSPGLTWVGGSRGIEDLDDTSRKILAASSSGTSIFDPVLCELLYKWFCPPGGKVLDPFAGGSVRGIVAGVLGRDYLGVELRPEQVAANESQLERLDIARDVRWLCGDSRAVIPTINTGFDFVFSCPPYGSLERYSDDPRDLSAMDREAFETAYTEIIRLACGLLNQDSFACFVVGNYRLANGFYHDLVGATVRAFEKGGAGFYNDSILVTAAGSLPIRAGGQFTATRKLGKTHQNVLVFCKGNPKRATRKCEVL